MVLKALTPLLMLFPIDIALAQSNCDSLKSGVSYETLLNCAETRSPDVQRAALELELSKSQVKHSTLRQSPEFSLDSFRRASSGQADSETELSLSFPIELGRKRSSRVSAAEAQAERSSVLLAQAKLKARSTTILKLHRLRQLLHEAEVIDESISTFAKLVSQYSGRLSLSPEQSMSVAVFRMSKSQYDLRKTEILDELGALDTFFKVSIGVTTEDLKAILPKSPKTWPSLETKAITENSPHLRLIQVELKSALAEQSVVASERWPTLMIGPSLKLQSESGQNDQFLGVNLSFSIPAFGQASASAEVANASVHLAESVRRNSVIELEKNREELERSYEASVKVLSSSLSHLEIEKKHTEIERLFLKGVVPSSLVIEAHRTFVELESERNARELKAIEILFSLYELDGIKAELN